MTHPHRARRILLALLALLVLGAAGFGFYAGDYYRAEPAALAILDEPGLSIDGDTTILSPASASNTGILFYPGAKVEAEAYLPLLDQLRDQGFTCFLIHMPANMAIFDADAALNVIAAHPEISHWYLAGHSMGGAMASSCAADNPAAFDGLILLGAYLYGDYPPADTLTIYGSLNESVAEKIDYTDNVLVIDGGNHAQFGNYGPQKGDPAAAISASDQQTQSVQAITDFIHSRG